MTAPMPDVPCPLGDADCTREQARAEILAAASAADVSLEWIEIAQESSQREVFRLRGLMDLSTWRIAAEIQGINGNGAKRFRHIRACNTMLRQCVANVVAEMSVPHLMP